MVEEGLTLLLQVPLPVPVTVPPLLFKVRVHAPEAVIVPETMVLPPLHMAVLELVTAATGRALTVTEDVELLQLVVVCVNVKATEPAATPVTIPALVTVATEELLLTHVPPLAGLKVIVDPAHKLEDGTLTVGLAFIVTVDVALLQVVAVLVNVNVTLPAATGVTTPALLMFATAVLLLIQVPPDVGVSVIVLPTQRLVWGVVTMGLALTVIVEVAKLHPVDESVKVNTTLPAVNAVTTPALVMVARDVLLLVQVPPEEGESVVVVPAHMLLG